LQDLIRAGSRHEPRPAAMGCWSPPRSTCPTSTLVGLNVNGTPASSYRMRYAEHASLPTRSLHRIIDYRQEVHSASLPEIRSALPAARSPARPGAVEGLVDSLR